uniref:Serine/arginine-rich splicing factor 1B n=1 Tax=Phallusia mammillata TaxID=59560 RepID=A0A6F9DA28_9ASCI|nr:serine/arginine-rich splicing factor 1B [Phallusia mammillata]CAB3231489.1 serine/arginine-rich splicing factor 1B [Phallusia mammillata]
MGSDSDSRVYVGNLPPDVREKEVEDLFYKYGRIRGVTLKNRRGPPFAFIEFGDYRDADDAVKGRNGYNFDGYRLRVEHPKAHNNSFQRQDYSSSFRGRGGGGFGGGGPSQRTKYRVMVTGLPPTGSWQDLKDHMREAGDVSYSDVYKDGSGIVDFVNKEDMKFAVRHLDDTKFKSHEVGVYSLAKLENLQTKK